MRLLIIQPGKVGDIINCLPIAAWYSQRGYKVDWLCPKSYHRMFEYVNYVTPVTENSGGYDKTIDLSFGLNQKTALHQMWLRKRKNKEINSFVSLKYEIADVPIQLLRNLEYNRNLQREKSLYDLVVTGYPYTLVHDVSDYGSSIETVLPAFENAVVFRPVGDYTIFDWRMVIENASEIHAIDSSLANFVDAVMTEAKLFYYISDRVPMQADRTILTQGWETINLLQTA